MTNYLVWKLGRENETEVHLLKNGRFVLESSSPEVSSLKSDLYEVCERYINETAIFEMGLHWCRIQNQFNSTQKPLLVGDSHYSFPLVNFELRDCKKINYSVQREEFSLFSLYEVHDTYDEKNFGFEITSRNIETLIKKHLDENIKSFENQNQFYLSSQVLT